MHNRRVVIIADDVEALGGVQKVANVLSEAFVERGYEVTLLGIRNSSPRRIYRRQSEVHVDSIFEESYADAAARASQEITDDARAAVWTEHRLSEMRGKERLHRYLSSWNASTVLVIFQLHSLKLLIEAGLLSRTDRPKVIAQYHGSFAYAEKRGYLTNLIDSFNAVDHALFLTIEEADFFKSAGVRNATAIANPPTSSLDRGPGGEWERRDNLAVSVGRLHAEKHLDDLVRAWAFLPASFSQWRLKIYGTGPEGSRLADLVAELGLNFAIQLMGEIADPFDALDKAKVHLLTSHHEGWGLVIEEAAACGVPTIAYDSGAGVRGQIISGENGVLVPSKEPHAFGAALKATLADDRLLHRLGINARAKLKSTDPSTAISQWERLFGSS